MAEVVLSTLEILPNVKEINKYYYWKLVSLDPDDDKFVDCFIAGSGNYLVTNDRHFNPLKEVPFPKIKIINIDEFLEIILKKDFF